MIIQNMKRIKCIKRGAGEGRLVPSKEKREGKVNLFV